MKTRRILQLSVLFALLLIITAVTSVLAFDPPTWPPGIPWATAQAWPTAKPLQVGESWSPSGPNITSGFSIAPAQNPAPISTPIVPAFQPAPIPVTVSTGASPANPIDPTDTWQALDAGASMWYRVGTGGVHMDVFLDAVPPSNMSMAIYAPRELGKPIGRGTPYQQDSTRLVWSGGNWRANGDWLAQITNGNPMQVRYKITSSARDISNKSCYGYWEYIGKDYVYWNICQ